MADTMTPLQRHRCMSRIRGRDTRPELLVRRFLRSGLWAFVRRLLVVPALPCSTLTSAFLTMFLSRLGYACAIPFLCGMRGVFVVLLLRCLALFRRFVLCVLLVGVLCL